jgi:transposase-like protein
MTSHWKDMCPYCRSEDFEMIGDPEFNDWWVCNSCKKEFGSFLSEEQE